MLPAVKLSVGTFTNQNEIGDKMSGRNLDDLIEQNETDLGFLSAYGGGETPEAILEHIQNISNEHFELKITAEGVMVKMVAKNLPLVASDLQRRGFLNAKLNKKRVEVTICDWGADQRRFIERLVEFIDGE